MKKITSIILTMLMIVGLAGCGGASSNQQQQQVPSASTPIEPSVPPNETQQVTADPVYSKDIDLGDGNDVSFLIFEENGEQSGSIVCTFDGKDPAREFAIMAALVLAAEEKDLSNFSVAIFSGDAVGMYIYENCKLSDSSMTLESFNGLETDEKTYEDIIATILSELGV